MIYVTIDNEDEYVYRDVVQPPIHPNYYTHLNRDKGDI
jgi:hypothetical protein